MLCFMLLLHRPTRIHFVDEQFPYCENIFQTKCEGFSEKYSVACCVSDVYSLTSKKHSQGWRTEDASFVRTHFPQLWNQNFKLRLSNALTLRIEFHHCKRRCAVFHSRSNDLNNPKLPTIKKTFFVVRWKCEKIRVFTCSRVHDVRKYFN